MLADALALPALRLATSYAPRSRDASLCPGGPRCLWAHDRVHAAFSSGRGCRAKVASGATRAQAESRGCQPSVVSGVTLSMSETEDSQDRRRPGALPRGAGGTRSKGLVRDE